MKITQLGLEVWMWVRQRCGIIRIKRKFYPVESNNWFYLAVPDYGGFNGQTDVFMTCNAQTIK